MTAGYGRCFAALMLTALLASIDANGQSPPKEIRGYRVYDAKINVSPATEPDANAASDAAVEIGDVSVADLGLSGLTLKSKVRIKARLNGSVDLITFSDFAVDGLPIEIREYSSGFTFIRGTTVELPAPIYFTIGASTSMRGAYRELTGSKKTWEITGTAFVFGRFKKFGWTFRRVVPVRVKVLVPNPLTTL